MNIPADLLYTKDHEWLRVEGTQGTMGITDYAQGELGDIVFVDFNEDTPFVQNHVLGTIEAVKTVSEILAPVAGARTENHDGLNDNPEIINTDPYGEGWLIKFKITDPTELSGLMNAEQYKAYIGQ